MRYSSKSVKPRTYLLLLWLVFFSCNPFSKCETDSYLKNKLHVTEKQDQQLLSVRWKKERHLLVKDSNAPEDIYNPELQPGYHHYFKESFQNESAWTDPHDYPYVWMTPKDDRLASLLISGDLSRLRMALHRHVVEKKNLTVAFLGGSITLGSSPDGLSYPQWFEVILRKHEPFKSAAVEGRLKVINAGSAGTSSSYMCLCHKLRLPEDIDVVFLEYAKNDAEGQRGENNFMQSPLRRTLERLIRKLLQYPNRPAVMQLQAYVKGTGFEENVWTVERELNEFSAYYRLPTISVKTAVFHLASQNSTGFNIHGLRNEGGKFHDEYIGKYFFMDGGGHPDPHTGYRCMGELAAQLVFDAAEIVGTILPPSSLEHDKDHAKRKLPIPMIPDNYESTNERCMVEHLLHDIILSSGGWNWTDEGRNKWGYVSTVVGSKLRMMIDSRLPSQTHQNSEASVRIAYLKSYEHMGMVKVSCLSGCSCQPQAWNTHDPSHMASLMKLHRFSLSQSRECELGVEVDQNSTSGEHKVKILGVMISEDPPQEASKHEWTDIHVNDDNQVHVGGLYVGK